MSELAAAEAIAELVAHDARVTAEVARLERASARHPGDLQGLAEAAAAAWAELAAHLLPDLADGRLQALADRLGLGELAPAAVHAAIAGERQGLERALAELAGHPEFAGREAHLADARARDQALREHLVALQVAVDGLRSEPFFEELSDVEYDTPHYASPWWTFKYYRHRRRADRIVGRQGPAHGATTFDALRRRYLEIREALAEVARGREAWTTRAATIERLIAAHAAALADLDHLEARALGRLRGRVVDHLHARPPERFADDAEAQARLRRARGLGLLRALLERAHRAWVEAPLQELRREHVDTQRDLEGLGRSPGATRRIDPAALLRRSEDRRAAWERRSDAYEGARRAILGFTDFAALDAVTTASATTSISAAWSIVIGEAIEPPPVDDARPGESPR